MNNKCTQCGKPLVNDQMALFTKYQVCKSCVKKNHAKATNKRGTK
jgi:formylmethanofuran dehydrogenase subunit E